MVVSILVALALRCLSPALRNVYVCHVNGGCSIPVVTVMGKDLLPPAPVSRTALADTPVSGRASIWFQYLDASVHWKDEL